MNGPRGPTKSFRRHFAARDLVQGVSSYYQLIALIHSSESKRVPFGHLSKTLRTDIRAFFGNYTRALEKGLELLYAAGDPGEIELACEGLNIGWQDEQALYFKERFLAPDHARLAEMMKFSAKLRKLGIAEQVGFGPTKTEFEALLAEHGLNENLNQRRRNRSNGPAVDQASSGLNPPCSK